MPFTPDVRKQILQRDHRCVDTDGKHMGGLEAAHLDHDKSKPTYNSVENGITLCTLHHLDQHLEHSALELGLKSEFQNRWAIKAICMRIADYFLKMGGL